MFYIRADANETIATGHVMRCLAIADAIKALGEDVTFLVADEKGEALIKPRGYRVLCLNSKWNDLEKELPKLIDIIKEQQISKLLIDTYQVTKTYLEELQAHTQVIYLDDLDAFAYPCDRIINYAVYAKECSFAKDSKGHLLGCAYMPLRKAFCGLPEKNISPNPIRLLLLSGGADSFHFAKKFLKTFFAWKASSGYQLTIICGAFHEDYEELCQIAKDFQHIIVKRNVTDIEQDMQQADIAISAGGTTLYELCACGTPTISYLLADNQKKNVACFSELDLIPYCGDIRTDAVAEKILEQIEAWAKNPAERCEISRKMQKLVDGKGAMRLAKELIKG